MFYLFSFLLLFSASAFEAKVSASYSDEEKLLKNFTSDLRPEKHDWQMQEVYTDTLKLVEFVADYDYLYGEFETLAGEEVSIFDNGDLDFPLANQTMVVHWQVGRFYATGEGEELFLAEKLLKLEAL